MELLAIIFLMVCSYTDLKYKEVSVFTLLIFSVLGFIVMIIESGTGLISYTECILNPLLGLVLLGISILTKGEIGQGDAFVIMITGCMWGATKNCSVFFVATIAAGIFSFLILIIKKYEKKASFPFIPFLLIGDIIVIITEKFAAIQL